MKPGTKIDILEGAVIIFPPAKPNTHGGGVVKMDREMYGKVITVYPNGTPNDIELVDKTIIKSGLDWEEDKDYRVIE